MDDNKIALIEAGWVDLDVAETALGCLKTMTTMAPHRRKGMQ
jgi:hypothetical protein